MTMTLLSVTLVGLPVTAVWWVVDLFLVHGIFLEETE